MPEVRFYKETRITDAERMALPFGLLNPFQYADGYHDPAQRIWVYREEIDAPIVSSEPSLGEETGCEGR